jgi:hypothetical protein
VSPKAFNNRALESALLARDCLGVSFFFLMG